MKERPILFSAPMVRALLNGSKTQTRRVVKPASGRHSIEEVISTPDSLAAFIRYRCPFGAPGDRLWVREAWRAPSCVDDLMPSEIPSGYSISFTANGGQQYNGRARPGMFMPRWASRITLEVTGVRVERLQAISEADAIAEGAEPVLVPPDGGSAPHVEGYRVLWESINGAGSWAANPWVWCVAFRKVTS